MMYPATHQAEMQQCIDACQLCHDLCLRTALTHCLHEGGAHVEEGHFRLMMNCAEICQTSANFMLGGSALHGAVCQACAQICNACAESCERIGSDMDECAEACRHCAESCESMAVQFHSGMPGARAEDAAQRPHA